MVEFLLPFKCAESHYTYKLAIFSLYVHFIGKSHKMKSFLRIFDLASFKHNLLRCFCDNY
jgi:hypothetical protein